MTSLSATLSRWPTTAPRRQFAATSLSPSRRDSSATTFSTRRSASSTRTADQASSTSRARNAAESSRWRVLQTATTRSGLVSTKTSGDPPSTQISTNSRGSWRASSSRTRFMGLRNRRSEASVQQPVDVLGPWVGDLDVADFDGADLVPLDQTKDDVEERLEVPGRHRTQHHPLGDATIEPSLLRDQRL